jgi:hypothetical protein
MKDGDVVFVIHPYHDEDDGPGWALYDETDTYKGWATSLQALLNATATRADKKRQKAGLEFVTIELRGVQQRWKTPPEVANARVRVKSG